MNMDIQRLDPQAAFTHVQSGIVPAMSTDEFAAHISSGINRCLKVQMQSPRCMTGKDTQTTLMFLTLSGKIISKLSGKSLSRDACMFYDTVMMRLFGVHNLTSHLVHLMKCQDRILSHLAAKCMASFVVYDVASNIGSNIAWKTSFIETFQIASPSCALDTHLWALTEVVKGVLKLDCVNKQEILIKVLSDFESSLTSLYPKLLFQENPEPAHAPINGRDAAEVELCACALLDLVEVLVAARMSLGLCFSAQRLPFLQTSALIHLTLSNKEEYVKKRALLMLKRILVHRAGEEWGLGETRCKERAEGYSADLMLMADAVLQEVDAGWLRKFRVKNGPSFFGGNKEDGETKDAVMLRAASLILIKCLELRTRHVSSQGSLCALDVRPCLTELLAFLQHQAVQLKEVTHLCCWILVVFTDQDDDLIESAKVLMTLYLHQRSLSSSDPAACEWGGNPHCHFILLLRSLSFDHTVLLDFLISNETCFLEYCVVYLKHLRDHWRDFCTACCHIENSETEKHTPTHLHSSEASGPSQSRKADFARFRAGLVDYECSEDSEDEDIMTRNAEEPIADIDVQAASGSSDTPFICPTFPEDLSRKVVQCLTELRTVINRVHSRGLFPYNPSSLLKLLLAIETKSHSENTARPKERLS